MRTLKLFIITLFGSVLLILSYELIWYLVKGPSSRTLYENIRILLPIILIMPVNALIHDRVVKREYFRKDFNKDKFNLLLKKYKAKSIKITEEKCEYEIPFLYSFDGEIVVEYVDELVKVSAPARLIRKLERYEEYKSQ